MSWNPAIEPDCPDAGALASIETQIIPRSSDIGGFEVRRALPSRRRRMVGPFIFFDQVGPADFITGQGIDVRPHPHIGLATVSYLYQGEFHHQDSLGTNQMIYPGDVNWMIAGNGITHSERTSAKTRQTPSKLFGIQTWVALPEKDEDRGPAFEHHAAPSLPFIEGEGKQVRLILGDAWGERAPARTFSELFYADAVLAPNALLPVPENHEERGLYIVEGSVEIAGDLFEAEQMMVFRAGDAITVKAGTQGARLMLLGGAPLEGPRHIWWNFVASSKDKIEAAKEAWIAEDWAQGQFRLPPEDNQEFIRLPS